MSYSVCHVSTMTRLGGVERLVVDFLTRPTRPDLRYSLLTTSSTAEVMRPIVQHNIPTFQPHRNHRYDVAGIQSMVQWFSRQQFDVVHTYNAFANVWGYMAARLARVPKVITGEHGTAWWVPQPMASLDRWAQHGADVIIANSQASATMLRHRYAVAPEKIRVVHNGVPPLPPADRDAIRRAWGWEDCVVLGTIGRLDTAKNYRVLLDTAAKLLPYHPNLRFLIIGGGPQEAALRAHAKLLGLGSRCILTGWRSDARELIQGCDLFVSTSLRETFGLALVEAALAQLPLVAPAVDGIPEIVQNGVNGCLLVPTDPPQLLDVPHAAPLSKQVVINGQVQRPRSVSAEALAHTLNTLINEPDRRQFYGAMAQQLAKQHFSLQRYQADLEAIYTEP